jgi:hypothetical protein
LQLRRVLSFCCGALLHKKESVSHSLRNYSEYI